MIGGGLKALKSFLQSTSGASKGLIRDHPLTAFGLIAPTAAYAAEEVVAPIGKGMIEATGIPERIRQSREPELYEETMERRNAQIGRGLETNRIEEMIQRNMEIVAQNNPHLYNQVMSGRVLPQGAVVLGGPRREDLMEELAYLMGSSSSPDEFKSLLS